MTIAYIAFGSNLGDRRRNIDTALALLRGAEGIKVTKVSSVIETEPEGNVEQGRFLNGVVEVGTDLSAEELLRLLQAIENRLGRTRPFKNSQRTIDLDIIFYGDEVIDEPGLVIPHPKWHGRDFVMGPLREIAPDLMTD